MSQFLPFIVLLCLTGQTLALFSFFSNRDDRGSNVDPQFELAPANATLSEGVGMTLGCVINVPVKKCYWAFHSKKSPFVRNEYTSFSPHFKKSDPRSERDCSLKIDPLEDKHSGFWICSAVPLFKSGNGSRVVLMSKPAHISVIKGSILDVTTLSTSTETTTVVHTSERPPEPRSLFADEELTTNPGGTNQFIIERNLTDDTLRVIWHLGKVENLQNCVWITPGRVRLTSSSSLSNSTWVSRSNSSCGILLRYSQSSSLTGTWSVIAYFKKDGIIKQLPASIRLDPSPFDPSDHSKQQVSFSNDWIAKLNHPVSVIIVSFCAIVVILAILIVIFICKVGRSKGKDKSEKESGNPNISIIDSLPVKNYIKNPDYHPTVIEKIEKVQERSLPETPRDAKTKESFFNRHSVIGIEVPSLDPADCDLSLTVHYSHILPKHPPPSHEVTYLTLKPRPKPKVNSDEYYEMIKKPLPPYENTHGLTFSTFGFSSLNRIKGESGGSVCSSSDSGVDSVKDHDK